MDKGALITKLKIRCLAIKLLWFAIVIYGIYIADTPIVRGIYIVLLIYAIIDCIRKRELIITITYNQALGYKLPCIIFAVLTGLAVAESEYETALLDCMIIVWFIERARTYFKYIDLIGDATNTGEK